MPTCRLSDGLEGVLEQFLRFAEGSRPLRKSSTLQQKICGYFSEICGLREVIHYRVSLLQARRARASALELADELKLLVSESLIGPIEQVYCKRQASKKSGGLIPDHPLPPERILLTTTSISS